MAKRNYSAAVGLIARGSDQLGSNLDDDFTVAEAAYRWRLFRVFGAGGFAEGSELRVEEFGGEGPREGLDCFALLRGKISEFSLRAG